ncbi:helix-turn-helix domain-containing protein [Brochothrix campestris]|uniref:Transcriptional repressor n=1 Tax=Brochothrix campestris FSL F6-1037 TaxID=1265861 RepID=W7CH81_9LIST|nr:helix-turn-helix domain-containing protein [Brochothrix campestris]EUJ36292.1 transcriptional repressor [Brochothrix campestris FSL F6-1037]
MEQFRCGTIIKTHRKKQGLSQGQLAAAMAVTKGAVSKWETGQSLPDITLLPTLANYFGVTIDALLGFDPQLSQVEIQTLYRTYCRQFATEPLQQVMAAVQQTISNYYGCMPLLLQLGILIVNHAPLASEPTEQQQMIMQAQQLFERVEKHTTEVALLQQTEMMLSYCAMALGEPATALALIKPNHRLILPVEIIKANAQLRLGQTEEAYETIQVSAYQYILNFIGLVPTMLTLAASDRAKVKRTVTTVEAVSATFGLNEMHPAIMLPIYVTAAQSYVRLEATDDALAALQKYVALVETMHFPLELQGNDFFDGISDWLTTLDLGTQVPRDSAVIKASLLETVLQSPFDTLAHRADYQQLISQLKQKVEE